MYSSSKKQRPTSAGYLARPKLGALRNLYSSKSTKPASSYGFERRKKARKSADKMDFRKRPDYADTAYREAVSRLRILLAESYTPLKRPLKELDSAGEETDNQSIMSAASRNSRPSHIHYRYSPTIPRRYPYYTPRNLLTHVEPEKPREKWDSAPSAPPELMSFIERQEDYIEQLEKESKFCRGELTTLLRKVKDVISENEDLHDKQKSSLIKSVFNRLETETETETENETARILKSPKRTRRYVALEGPTIVFESRISELEAQLTQTKIDLRKAQDENDAFKKKVSDGSFADSIGLDTYKKQIESLQRDKNLLQETVSKLQSALMQLRDKENSTTDQVKRSLDAAEHAQYEKSAADLEVRRLKDELERQHSKIRDIITEQSRRISDERSAMERRYTQQIEQLTTELGVQWETTSKVQLELDKLRRENAELRREVAQKQAHIDELKKEMQNKIANMQSDIGLTGAEKSALEQQISTLQLANERNERQGRQDQARLQAELQSLRQRLDRADADLIHSRRENIRLSEQIASLEKEINMTAALSDERSKRAEPMALPPPKEDREKELSSMVKEMESKHAATVAELEGMIHSQNQLMDKLTGECHALTFKLEDASTRHKEEIRELQANLDYLSSRVNHAQSNNKLPSRYEDEEYNIPSTQRTAQHVPAAAQGSRGPPSRVLSRTGSSASVKPSTPSRKPSIQSQQGAQDRPESRQETPRHTPEQYGSQQKLDSQPYGSQDSQPYGSQPKLDSKPYGSQDSQPYGSQQKLDSQPYGSQQKLDSQPYGSQQKLDSQPDPYESQQKLHSQPDPYGSQQKLPSQQPENQQYGQNQEMDQNQYYTDPNQSYTGQEYTGDPNYDQQYDPNQPYDPSQYQYDPNQEYDPQQYEQYPTDPNSQYGYDPAYTGEYTDQQQYDQPQQQFDQQPQLPQQQSQLPQQQPQLPQQQSQLPQQPQRPQQPQPSQPSQQQQPAQQPLPKTFDQPQKQQAEKEKSGNNQKQEK